MEKRNRQLNYKERLRKNYKASKARDVEMDLQAATSRSSNFAIQVDSKNSHSLFTTASKIGQQVTIILKTKYEPKFEAYQMWIPKTQVHHIDLHWGWVPKSLLKTAPTIQTKQEFHQLREPQPYNRTKSLRNPVLHDQPHQQWIPRQMEKPKQEWRPKVTLQSSSTVISQF